MQREGTTILSLKLVKAIPVEQLTPAATLGRDYRENFARLQPFYTFAPGQWREKLASLARDYPAQRRQPLADELMAYHQRLDAPQPVLDNIERLRRPQTWVVSTGQQPGLLTGPLFTVYKALSAIKLARQLAQELGAEVVPVFWSASEDHDLEEINQANLLTRQDELAQLKFPVPEHYHGWRVGQIPVTGSGNEFLAQLEGVLAESDFRPSLLNLIKSSRQASLNWGDWFSRQMLALFGRWGLVMADANQPGLRRLLAPVMRKAVEEPLLFSRLVNEQGAKLAKLGYKEQLKRPATACCFFLVQDGQRQRVDFVEGMFKTAKTSYSPDELLPLLAQQPESFSSNVVLRPPGGDYLFPNLAYVGGEAEIAYFAQLKPVYEHLGVQMPILAPRYSLTLVETRIQKILARYNLDPVRLQSHASQQFKQFGRQYCQLASHNYWQRLKQRVMTPLNDLRKEAELEQLVLAPLEAGINKIAWQLDQLEEKLIQQCQKSNQLLRQQLTRAYHNLFPQGKPQERQLNFFYFYNKYGEGFLPALFEALPEDSKQHYFLGIEAGG